MKNNLKLLVCLLLALAFCFFVLACNESEPQESSTSSTGTQVSSTNNSSSSGDVASSSTNTSSNTDISSDSESVDSSTDESDVTSDSSDSESGDSSTDSSVGGEGTDKPTQPEIPEKTDIIPIDYSTMTYVGTSLKDFSTLFDEQYSIGDPRYDLENGIFPKFPSTFVVLYDADGNGDINDKDREHFYEITVDLGAEHYIESIYVFFSSANYKIIFETGEPFKYDNIVTHTSSFVGWAEIELNTFTRYINVKYPNGQSASELVFYGARTGEYEAVNTEPHQYKDFNYFLGINGNQADKRATISCGNYFRDYVNWLWCFDIEHYPAVPGTTFTTTMSDGYDVAYQMYKKYGVDAVPCYMFRASDFAVTSIEDYTKPETYVAYGEFMFQVALRFGYNVNNTKDMIKVSGLQKKFNRNYITWIEAGNEPNGEGNDGFSPYELAALTSTSYDGHCGTVIAETGSGVGVISANANVKMAMAGLAGVNLRYIQAMSFWLEHNRTNGELGLDAFNVHTYCKKLINYNGYQVYVGVCPEIGNITEHVKALCEWRDMYYPDKEVWLTEFGWDTNTSYQTENACHPYGPYSARQLQAMWLVRAYFMFSSVGVDRAAMYMAQDLGNEATSTGKYGTSGVISSSGEYKDSYYYIYTLKNTMGDMHFAEIIDSGEENVWIYRFENGEGKSCYAVWCPTMDDIRFDGFKLNIDGASATLTEFEYGEMSGISSSLTVTNGTVTINVSEKPVLIFSE